MFIILLSEHGDLDVGKQFIGCTIGEGSSWSLKMEVIPGKMQGGGSDQGSIL